MPTKFDINVIRLKKVIINVVTIYLLSKFYYRKIIKTEILKKSQ